MKALSCILFLGWYALLPAYSQIEPSAGKWKTWVLASGSEIKMPAPPTGKAAREELKTLLALQAQRDPAAISQINYWNAGAPGYRWSQIGLRLSPNVHAGMRMLALLHVAIYDATIAAWHYKYAFNRNRPARASAHLQPFIATPLSPSYPCEHAVAAGAAATVLAYLFPARADSLQQLAQQALRSRELAGVQYPSDVLAGYELGRQVGEKVVAWARQDNSDMVWQGSRPDKPHTWQGKDPVGATMGNWNTWVLTSGSQFRPGPPPDFARDMQELKRFQATNQTRARAFYYATQNFWTTLTHQKLFEYHLTSNAPRAARVYALQSVAVYDAAVACWDAKYTYWGIRPHEYDPTYKPLLGPPPFPGYPSGHAATSNAAATVLAYLFPDDSQYCLDKARECAESRFEGGIHFRTDNEVGLVLGGKVGQAVVRWAQSDGADPAAPASGRQRVYGEKRSRLWRPGADGR